MNKILECKNIYKKYDQLPVLNGVDLTLYEGESIAITGSSGSGKSTLLHILGLLDNMTQGDILFQGKSLVEYDESAKNKFRNEYLGFIYQFHHLLTDFNALENVAMPLLIQGQKRKAAFKKAKDLLNQVGLAQRISHKPFELSGGERQRVAIARALVNDPKLILADEPTGNLDYESREEVMDLISKLNEINGHAFIMVTHDRELANRMDKHYSMQQGQLHLIEELINV